MRDTDRAKAKTVLYFALLRPFARADRPCVTGLVRGQYGTAYPPD